MMIDLILKQTILVLKLLNFTLHLSLQTLILEIFHFQAFPKLAYLQVHQAPSLFLRSSDLRNLLNHLPFMTFLLPSQLI